MAQLYSPGMVNPQALAAQLKATQQFTPATIGPDILARQLKLQQDTANAQRLLQDASTPLQGQMVSGHYVAPAWTQMAAQALKSYLGQKAANEIPKQYMGLQQAQQANMAQQFGIGGGQPQMVASAGQSMPVQPQAANPSVPLLPGRSATESFAIAQQMGMPAYLKLALEQSKPTDLQMNLQAAGLQPGSPEFQRAIMATTDRSTDLQKNLTAAGLQPGSPGFQRAVMASAARPINVAPGGTLIDPITGRPTMTAPQNGIQVNYGPDGQASAAQVPGYAGANAQITGAQELAKQAAGAQFDLVDVPDGKGGTIKMPRSQAVMALGQGSGSPVAPAGNLGQTPSATQQTARAGLPKIDAQAAVVLDTIDKTLNHPGLPYSVGAMSLAPTVPGTKQADFRAMADQLKGQTFLQAFESLKGGGAITEVEGQKAENAIARLNSAQSEGAYKQALTDFRNIVSTARQRAYQQAGISAPNAAGVFNPQSAEDFQALPSGSLFKAPDGTMRRKP